MSNPYKVSDIKNMQGDRVRFAHVAKHLYNPREHWKQVIPDLGDPRRGACEAGCPCTELHAPHPDCDRVTHQCRQHVLCDHDKVLSPAYCEALVEAERSGRLGLLEDKRGWAFVGNHGVFVIVREVGRPRCTEVKTAYRVVPRPSEGTKPDNFFKAAVRKLRDKTSWDGGGSL